jgi:hypothetical protein
MKPERRHRPSKPSNAPLDGFLYFVLPETRMSRRWDMGCLPVPSHWKQVSLAEYLEFRSDTKRNYTAKHLRALAQLATLQKPKGK